jgi:hypothetical protein
VQAAQTRRFSTRPQEGQVSRGRSSKRVCMPHLIIINPAANVSTTSIAN